MNSNNTERRTFMGNKVVISADELPVNGALSHHGIKGQRWGFRRFQKEDGSRTAAGKKRDRDRDRDYEKSEDHKSSRSSKSKGPDSLSNDELKKLNERLRLEEDYKRLTAPEKVEKGESWIKGALAKAGKDTVSEITKGIMLGSAKLLIAELSPNLAKAAGFTKGEQKKKAGD